MRRRLGCLPSTESRWRRSCLFCSRSDQQNRGRYSGRQTLLRHDRKFSAVRHAPVPWKRAGRYAERSLREVQEPSQIGARLRGNSVRQLETSDFNEIVECGLTQTLARENAIKLGLDSGTLDSTTNSLIDEYALLGERRIAEMLVNRKIRDARFRGAICEAYDNRCAVTGLRIITGGGRAEVQAAHIWPVKDGGPDVVQNGIALSATAH